MSLLVDIQDAAVDQTSSVGTLLRKCKVLAARLDNKPLEDWVAWESNGYPEGVAVPAYRRWPLAIKGHFSGPFGARITNSNIPHASIPDSYRERVTSFQCRQSVASVEAMLSAPGGDSPEVPMGDLFVVLGPRVIAGYNCVAAWGEFSNGHLVELVNAVRNRVIDFSLALWKEYPDAGALSLGKAVVPADRITQIFVTTVNGGSATIAGSVDTLNAMTVLPNDRQSLRDYMLKSGADAADVVELDKALLAEPARPPGSGVFGPSVAGWISRMMKKAAEGTWQVSLDVAGQILSDALIRYYTPR